MDHPQYEDKIRVVRATGHNTLPNFIGKWFLRADERDEESLNCAMMLLLLKPWQEVADIRENTSEWKDALEDFLTTASPHCRQFMNSVQDYHQCKATAEAEDQVTADLTHRFQDDINDTVMQNNDDDEWANEHSNTIWEHNITDDDVLHAEATKWCDREALYAEHAIAVARVAGVFPERAMGRTVSWDVLHADEEMLQNMELWRAKFEASSRLSNQSQQSTDPQLMDVDAGDVADMQTQGIIASADDEDSMGDVLPMNMVQEPLAAIPREQLMDDQRRAFDIIAYHVRSSLQGNCPTQLLLHIQGEGGTGKSKVIQAVTGMFEALGVRRWLLKSAYTGIAASLIEGETIHRLAGLNFNGKGMSNGTRTKLESTWKDVQYLIIDEVLMVSKKILAQMLNNIVIAKASFWSWLHCT